VETALHLHDTARAFGQDEQRLLELERNDDAVTGAEALISDNQTNLPCY
jgi:hypothetical protein